jgi:hypothetical protein
MPKTATYREGDKWRPSGKLAAFEERLKEEEVQNLDIETLSEDRQDRQILSLYPWRPSELTSFIPSAT